MPRTSFAAAQAEVARRDPVLASFIERAGPFRLPKPTGDAFAALAESILYQQLAGAAAAAIHRRFVDLLGTVTPEAVLSRTEEELRSAGLSRAKAASIQDLAEKVAEGTVPADGYGRMSDEEIVERLVTVRGIGRWTAEMFLLFELRRLDVWPVDDYGVRQGWALIYSMPELPTARQLGPLGESFRPYRSVVAWYCWEAVHISRRR